MPLDLPVIPEPTVLRSATTTFVTPRCDSAQAAAVPSMPPPTITTSAFSGARFSSRERSSAHSSLRASAHRRTLLFARALIGALFSSRERSSARNPVGAGKRDAGHRRRLDRDGDEVLGFEVAHVRL